MANEKPMSAMAFQTKLKEQYKEDGEVNVDERVDTLMQTIQKQNKDNNPFLFSELSNWIETQEITLDELVSPNGSVHQTELGRIIQVSQIEWAKVQQSERTKEENNKDPFLEQMLENERQKKAEEAQKIISTIDFEHLSFSDVTKAEEYYEFLSVEEKKQVNEEVYKNFERPAAEAFKDIVGFIQAGDEEGLKKYLDSLDTEIKELFIKEEYIGKDGSPDKDKFLKDNNKVIEFDNAVRTEVSKSEEIHPEPRDILNDVTIKHGLNPSASSIFFGTAESQIAYVANICSAYQKGIDYQKIAQSMEDGVKIDYSKDDPRGAFATGDAFKYGQECVVAKETDGTSFKLEYDKATEKKDFVSVMDETGTEQDLEQQLEFDENLDINGFLDGLFEEMPDYYKVPSLDQTYENDIGVQEEGIRLTVEETSEVLEAETESVAEIEETTEQRPTDEDIHREEVETVVEEVKEQANELNDYTKEVQDRSLKAFFKNVFDRITRKRIGDGTRKTEGNATQKPAYRKDKRGLVEKISDAYTDWRTGLRTPGEALKSIVTFEDKDLEKPEVNNQPNQLIGNSDSVDPFKKGVDEKVMQNIEVVQQHAQQVQKAIAEGKIIPQNVKNAGVKVKSNEEGPGIGGE